MANGPIWQRGGQFTQASREGAARAEARSGLQASGQLESVRPSVGGILLAAVALVLALAAAAWLLHAVGLF